MRTPSISLVSGLVDVVSCRAMSRNYLAYILCSVSVARSISDSSSWDMLGQHLGKLHLSNGEDNGYCRCPADAPGEQV